MTPELRALAFVVAAIRPAWDRPGIETKLAEAIRTHPLADVAHAAVDAARTPTTKTPAGIVERLRGGWRTDAAYEQATPTPPPVAELWKQLPRPEERKPGPSVEQRALIDKAIGRFNR